MYYMCYSLFCDHTSTFITMSSSTETQNLAIQLGIPVNRVAMWTQYEMLDQFVPAISARQKFMDLCRQDPRFAALGIEFPEVDIESYCVRVFLGRKEYSISCSFFEVSRYGDHIETALFGQDGKLIYIEDLGYGDVCRFFPEGNQTLADVFYDEVVRLRTAIDNDKEDEEEDTV